LNKITGSASRYNVKELKDLVEDSNANG